MVRFISVKGNVKFTAALESIIMLYKEFGSEEEFYHFSHNSTHQLSCLNKNKKNRNLMKKGVKSENDLKSTYTQIGSIFIRAPHRLNFYQSDTC